MRKRVSAATTAYLLILMIQRYSDEKDRAVRRARFSRKTMLRVSGRKTLRESFLSQVNDEMVDIGWTMLTISEGFAMVHIDVAESWTLIASKRITSEIRDLKSGKLEEDDILNMLEDDTSDDLSQED